MPTNVRTVLVVRKADGTWQDVPPLPIPEGEQYLISFELAGAHDGIQFNPNDPIWVRANQKPDTANNTDDQIPSKFQLVTRDGKELIVLDLNNNDPAPGPLPLHYQLNFIGPNAQPLDPIIENGGGSEGVYDSQNFLADKSSEVIIALAILLVLLGGAIGALVAKQFR